MGDSYNSKPGSRPRNDPSSVTPASARDKASSDRDPGGGKAGRIVHDARGNAVWDWVKDTTRIAIDSTSRLLKRLEVPELKVEDGGDQELRIESDRDAGGGYDPYGSKSPPGRSAGAGAAPASSRDPWGRGNTNNSGGGPANAGGGYDPYGKSAAPRKPTRKP